MLTNVLDGLDDVQCIHPSATSIAGSPALPSLDAPVDLALVLVPVHATEKAVQDAVDGGARVVVVLSSGFGEAGSGDLRCNNDLLR